MNRPVVLMILDGWGLAPEGPYNAAKLANTPTLDRLFKECAHASLACCGETVGLPTGQQGNSEVGHLNLGAGRIVYQDLLRIENDIKTGSYLKNETFNELMDATKKSGKKLHLMGLLSDGGVHSHQNHLYELIKLARNKGLTEVYIHAFLDGRDVPPDSGLSYVQQLESVLREYGVGKIATVSGRYYAMDRDKRWDRIEKAWRAMVLGEGEVAISGEEAVRQSYEKDIMDEFVLPTVIQNNGNAVATLDDGDSVIFYNYRADRAREIINALGLEDFDGFSIENRPILNILTMTEYEAGMDKWLTIAYPPLHLKNTLGEWLSAHGCRQLRIAETEKYAHVTFFFNGGIEEANPLETRVLVPSPKVATYDLQPEMSAKEVTDVVVKALNENTADFILVNFANPDMVGHTGKLDAAVSAVEAVDAGVERIVDALSNTDGRMIICADHGNCEMMADDEGRPVTSHTTNRVPIILVGAPDIKIHDGALCDVSPTILDLLNLEVPTEMTGHSLIDKN